MLADFYIPMRSNDMKIAVQKNHCTDGWILLKKNGVNIYFVLIGISNLGKRKLGSICCNYPRCA